MNQLDIIQQLGEDVILLTRPDNWIDQRKRTVSNQLSILVEEVKALENVTTIKRKMQDKNLVAVKHIQAINGLRDEIIEIMELPEAVELMTDNEHIYDSCGQINVWRADGYDVDMVTKFRSD